MAEEELTRETGPEGSQAAPDQQEYPALDVGPDRPVAIAHLPARGRAAGESQQGATLRI